MSRKKKNHPEKTWPELAAITVAKRACDWATEVTWTVSYTAWEPDYEGDSDAQGMSSGEESELGKISV